MSRLCYQKHPYLDRLDPYVPPDLEEAAARIGVERSELLRLSANENQYGPSPRAVAALAEYGEHGFYPQYSRLRQALAKYAGVGIGQLVLTNGADEAIDLLIRVLVEPGETVVVCPPTFGMYEFCALVNRCHAEAVPRRADLTLDLPAIGKTVEASGGSARLLFIASPGNPHGLATPLCEVERLLEMPIFVAVDEAYIEFGGDSAVSLLDRHENLVVIRTFSKWAGLAGLRLGYVMADPGVASLVDRVRVPYNVSSAAVVAAQATLDDSDGVLANVRRLVAERDRMHTELAMLPYLEPVPGHGNFVLARVHGLSGEALTAALARQGILVQGFFDPVLASYVRITVGRPEQNDGVLRALQDVGDELGGASA